MPDGGWSFNALGCSTETTERSFQKKLNGIEPVFSSPVGAIQKIRKPLFPNTLSAIPFQVPHWRSRCRGKVIETQRIDGGGSNSAEFRSFLTSHHRAGWNL